MFSGQDRWGNLSHCIGRLADSEFDQGVAGFCCAFAVERTDNPAWVAPSLARSRRWAGALVDDRLVAGADEASAFRQSCCGGSVVEVWREDSLDLADRLVHRQMVDGDPGDGGLVGLHGLPTGQIAGWNTLKVSDPQPCCCTLTHQPPARLVGARRPDDNNRVAIRGVNGPSAMISGEAGSALRSSMIMGRRS